MRRFSQTCNFIEKSLISFLFRRLRFCLKIIEYPEGDNLIILIEDVTFVGITLFYENQTKHIILIKNKNVYLSLSHIVIPILLINNFTPFTINYLVFKFRLDFENKLKTNHKFSS